MEYVIDFQSFRDDGNNYIIKELCVQPIVNAKFAGICNQYLFLPPFDYRHLSEKKKKVNDWINNNYLGLSWNCGLTEYSELPVILNSYIYGKCIYIKGREKKITLQKELNCHVKIVDIESLKCPSLSVLKKQSVNSIRCPYDHSSTNCALNNVFCITKWIIQYWNCLCNEHDEETKRINCWDCMIA